MDTKVENDAPAPTDSIESSGYPLGFMVAKGTARPGVLGTGIARDVFKVEARQFGGHQKEAVVHEGAHGSRWRMVSDEGRHISGTDLAPFPLGFYNAALHGDLGGRIVKLAPDFGVAIDNLALDVQTAYSLTGSFTRGDATGYAEPADITVRIDSGADAGTVRELVDAAVAASPALATMHTALVNTFAIYVNGRRREVTTLAGSPADDAADPYRTYSRPPSPLAGAATLDRLIHKTGEVREGEITPAASSTTTRILRTIAGTSTLIEPGGVFEIDTVLGLPGMSHFSLKCDERPDGDQAPSALALLSASIVFCYMTQISRYIHHMKLDIRGARVVQYMPFAIGNGQGPRGIAEPVDTHLFLSGGEDDETHEELMMIAARTCYLHATLIAALEPKVGIVLNGGAIG